jgi:hypothetical protein
VTCSRVTVVAIMDAKLNEWMNEWMTEWNKFCDQGACLVNRKCLLAVHFYHINILYYEEWLTYGGGFL